MFRSEGVTDLPVYPALPRLGCFLGALDGRVGQGVVAVAQRSSQAGAQGQSVGRCRTSRRAVEAIRAGMAMRWVRRVAHRAFACRTPAAAPPARRRLNAVQASASQAALAVNFPSVIWSLPWDEGADLRGYVVDMSSTWSCNGGLR